MAISISVRAETHRWLSRRMLWVLGSVAALFLLRGRRRPVALVRVPRPFDRGDGDVVALACGGLAGQRAVTRATNVPWLDEAAVEHRLEDRPGSTGRRCTTSLPWTIQVEISERVPVAVANDGVRELLVAGDGTILGDASRSDRRLPRIELPVAADRRGRPADRDGAASDPRRDGTRTPVGGDPRRGADGRDPGAATPRRSTGSPRRRDRTSPKGAGPRAGARVGGS